MHGIAFIAIFTKMNKNQLIETAANSRQLRDYCKFICKNRDIHNDVFQEFLLILLEKDEKLLLNIYKEIQFISYCKKILTNLNLYRIRCNNRLNTSNTLSERHNIYEVSTDIATEYEYNYEVDSKFDRVMDFLEKEKKVKKYQVEILFNSISKSTRELSEVVKMPQRRLIYENNKLKDLIKKNIK